MSRGEDHGSSGGFAVQRPATVPSGRIDSHFIIVTVYGYLQRSTLVVTSVLGEVAVDSFSQPYL
jgi:hypothetical protein